MGNKTAGRRGILAKKSRKKQRRAEDGRHYKVPGFDAFSPHPAPNPTTGSGKGKARSKAQRPVPCEAIVEPEKGIHSQAWAAAIVPQDTGFLKLPFEVRLKIYEHAIDDFVCGVEGIEPRKNGKKFWSVGWKSAAEGLPLPLYALQPPGFEHQDPRSERNGAILCVTQYTCIGRWLGGYTTTMALAGSGSIERRLRDCEALRAIGKARGGLESFELEIAWPKSRDPGSRVSAVAVRAVYDDEFQEIVKELKGVIERGK
ncbi:hypothetical protein VTL71DRAFT_11934 [Oculimacula yallundae]|uniref:Uncharacterized protein n=1 Tax=Oculimacula yallundae TaxID=86028 RepID=A0ABR4CT44_9HELO